jgi:hypothetical protein
MAEVARRVVTGVMCILKKLSKVCWTATHVHIYAVFFFFLILLLSHVKKKKQEGKNLIPVAYVP